MTTGKWIDDSGMRHFITLSRIIRRNYKKELPFISVMCKLPQREDVKLSITRYISYKNRSQCKP